MARRNLRENTGGIHYSQQDQKRVHFGLAAHREVTELRIHWPSGIRQTLKNLPVNQVLRVVERGVEPSMPADVNSDGVIDIADLLLVGKYVGEDPLTYPSADVNGDGKVDIADMIEIIESAVKTTTAAGASKHRVTGEMGAAVSALYHKI